MAQNKIRTADIVDNQVTIAKMQQIATTSLLGRATASTGNVEILTIGSGFTLTGTTLSATVSSIPTLQQVTTAGNSIINNMYITDIATTGMAVQIQKLDLAANKADGYVQVNNTSTGEGSQLQSYRVHIQSDTAGVSFSSLDATKNLNLMPPVSWGTTTRTIRFPDASGTIALTTDIPSAGANSLGTYIVKTATNAPTNAQILASLATGIVKNTTTTGVLSIAIASDFPTLNQSTTGSAATLTTTRTIWGQNFNGNANVTGDITLGTSNITMTGSIAATGSRVTKGWFTDIESTNMITIGGTSLSSVTATFTNKRINPRVQAVTSSATVTPNADTDDAVDITAQTVGLTLANPSGTPVNKQPMVIAIYTASAQTLAVGTQYKAVGVTIPIITVAGKQLYLGMMWNSRSSTWDVTGVSQEA